MHRLLQYLLLLAYCFIITANSLCSNDEDLQSHQCQCNEIDRSIRCSTLPDRCRICEHYRTIYFDQPIDILPGEILAKYRLSKKFRIQFVQLKNISRGAFSKIHLQENQILDIEILKYSSSNLFTHAFERLILESNSRFHLQIAHVINSIFTIEKHAFNAIQFHRQSHFQFSILHATDTIAFQTHSGRFSNEHFFDGLSMSQFRIDGSTELCTDGIEFQ